MFQITSIRKISKYISKFLLQLIKIRYSLIIFRIIDKVSLLRRKYQRFSRGNFLFPPRSVIIQRNGNSRFGEGKAKWVNAKAAMHYRKVALFPRIIAESTVPSVPTFPRLIDRIRSRGNFGSTNQVGKPSLAGRFTGGGLNTRQSVVSSLFADD